VNEKSKEPLQKALFNGKTLKRAPANEADFRPGAARGKFLDLGSSYGEEEGSSGEKKNKSEEYGSSDEMDDEGALEEGELNSAQKLRLKRDLLMMGYDDDEDYEEKSEVANLGKAIAGSLSQEEQFAMNKKLFAQ